MTDLHNQPALPPDSLRLIAIDDEAEWCTLLATTARVLGYALDSANTLEEAVLKIQEAERLGQAYHIALVDMNFETGRRRIELPRGKEVVQRLKSDHPYLACIMVSGAGVAPETVLDMRDDFNLDYYLRKDHFDIDSFNRSIIKVMRRVRAANTAERYAQELQRLLHEWQSIYLHTYENYTTARKRQAMKGVDVDVATVREIERYQAELREAEQHINTIQQKLDELVADR